MRDVNQRWKEQRLGEAVGTRRFLSRVLSFVNVFGNNAVTISCWEFRVPMSSGVFSAFKPNHLWMKLPWGRVVCGVSLVGWGVRVVTRGERKAVA